MQVSLRQLTRQEVSMLSAGGPMPEPAALAYPGALPPPYVLNRALAKLEEGQPESWWLPFLIARLADGAAVGGCAFKGPPQDGTVEVLYGVSKHCRGLGYASAALRQLAAIAFSSGAASVLAEIEPDNIASSRTVEKCGFQRRCERIAEDGTAVVQWVLARAGRPGDAGP